MKAESFGYKNAWIACRSASTSAVATALGLTGVAPAAWKEGVEASYELDRRASHQGDVFVTPPLDGWVLVVGRPMWTLADSHPPRAMAFCAQVSRALDGVEVQYFSTYRVVEAHAWARARNGVGDRSFVFVEGEVLEDFGGQSDEEKMLGFNFQGLDAPADVDVGPNEDMELELPGESDVMALAGLWSVDPSTLEAKALEVDSGLLGRISLPEPSYPRRAPQVPTVVESGPPVGTNVQRGHESRAKAPWWRFW